MRHGAVRATPDADRPAAGRVIAVDLGGTKCHGALADLDGRILAEDVRPTHEQSGPSAALLDCIGQLRAVAAAESVPVRALVVGVPALIDPRTGLASAGPNVNWDGFDLVGLLADRLTVPFEVGNDVNLAAIGQAWRGEGAQVPSFFTLSIGTGIGGALVIDGKLVAGRYNAAGEIGYLELPTHLSATGVARFEDLASGKAIEARAADGSTGLDVPGVFAAAADGDGFARTVLAEVVRHVARAIVSIVALVDPHRVILDGSVGRSLAPYLDEIRELAYPQVVGYPEVLTCTLNPNATIVGGIGRALSLVQADHQGDSR